MFDIDEKIAILHYESKLIRGEGCPTVTPNENDPIVRNRIALAIFRHVIENVLDWTPKEATEKLTIQSIEDMKLMEEWNNLDLPEDVRQSGSTNYVVEILYPNWRL